MDSVFQKPLDDDIQDVAEGMAIVINGDTAPQAISSGQYLFIKNHSTLATGGYHATAAITSGGNVTSSNVAADANGIVNAAYSSLNGNITTALGGLKFKRIQINGTTSSAGQLEIDNTTGSTVVFLLRNTYDDNVSSSFGVINIENVTETKIRLRFRTLRDGSVNAGASINISIVVAYI